MLERFPDAAAGLCVKAGGQLVKKHQLRLREQRQHDEKPLTLAARETLDRRAGLVPDAELAAKLPPVGRTAVEAGRLLAELGDPDLFLIVALLKLHADAPKQCAAFFLRILSQQPDCAAVGLLRAEQAFDRGALSRAVRAKQTEDRAAFYREVQMVDHRSSAVDFRQTLGKDRLAHSETLLTARSSM